MKKLIALASASILALAFAAPVAADTFVDGNYAPDAPKDEGGTVIVVPDGFIAVCHIPGDKDANKFITGTGWGCVENLGGIVKLLPVSALGGMIK